ncbi:MAG: hypothetical protein D6742_02725 [Cyanobacteria bacterium J069]|nr:MAG: hypothetical protein D6742_02725 [Cyanobacteria bacterium J069]
MRVSREQSYKQVDAESWVGTPLSIRPGMNFQAYLLRLPSAVQSIDSYHPFLPLISRIPTANLLSFTDEDDRIELAMISPDGNT